MKAVWAPPFVFWRHHNFSLNEQNWESLKLPFKRMYVPCQIATTMNGPCDRAQAQ